MPRRALRPPTLLSAFTGAGGLDLGLHRAGFLSVGAIERDAFARQTIKDNGLWPLLEPGDITDLALELTPVDLGLEVLELGILAGAPPCQPFSKASQWAHSGRTGLRDSRSNCVWAFFELVSRFLPKAVLLENVPGFVRGETSALQTIEKLFGEINTKYGTRYFVSHAIVDASDYGVPQNRERAIIVALRDGTQFKWPRPTHAGSPIRSYDAIGGLRPGTPPQPRGKWARLLPSIPEGRNYLFHTPGDGGEPLFGRRTRFWSFLLKLAKDAPAWTLPAQPGPSTGPFHWTGRPLAIDEMLRLQSFPKEWKVSGSRQEQIRQVGNATPPLLAEVIGRAIGRQVFRKRYRGEPSLTIERKARIPAPTKPEPVPVEYRDLKGDHLAHPGCGKGPKPRIVAAS